MEMPRTGDIFEGRYELHSLLGKGGFAKVFHATDVASGRQVALKILNPKNGEYTDGVASRFDREVRVLARLRDPHTITMYDFGKSANGLLYMVFEYVEGNDLSELIQADKRLPEREIIYILDQVLQSLREAHSEGLLHRDLKPANIRIYEYMGDRRKTKLLDFGIAKPVAAGEGAITQDGIVIGTPQYMASEQLYGRELTPATDIFALGLVAYEMIVSEQAIQDPSPMALARRLSRDIKLPDDAQVSPRFRAIIERMLSSEPSHRYTQADDLIQELRDENSAAPTQKSPAVQGNASRSPGPQAGRVPNLDAPPMGAKLPADGVSTPQAGIAMERSPKPAPAPEPVHPEGPPTLREQARLDDFVTEPGMAPVPAAHQQERRGAAALPPTETVDRPAVADPAVPPARTEQPGKHRTASVGGPPTTMGSPPPEEKSMVANLAVTIGGLAIGGLVAAGVLFFVLPKDEPTPQVAPPVVEPPSVTPTVSDIEVEPAPEILAAPNDAGAADGAKSTSGCGGPSKAGFLEFSTRISGERRRYNIYVPAEYNPRRRHAVVMMFHEALRSGHQFVQESDFQVIADRENLVLIAPENPRLPIVSRNDFALAREAFEKAREIVCIDEERVFAVGDGHGGELVENLACHVPLAAMATMSYRSEPEAPICARAGAIPYLHLVGTADPYNPIDGGYNCANQRRISLKDKEKIWRTQNVCAEGRRRYKKARGGTCHTWSCEAPFVLCKLNGGHGWLKLGQPITEVMLSGCQSSPADFPISETMWQFFSEANSAGVAEDGP